MRDLFSLKFPLFMGRLRALAFAFFVIFPRIMPLPMGIVSFVVNLFSMYNINSGCYFLLVVWVYSILFWCYHCSKSKFQTDLGKDLHAFDVCKDWILIQTLCSPQVDDAKLRDALITLDVRDLNGCPGQSRWSIGSPDIQSMATELGSVVTWLEMQVCNIKHCTTIRV